MKHFSRSHEWSVRRGGEHASKLSCLGERSEPHENVRASGEAAGYKPGHWVWIYFSQKEFVREIVYISAGVETRPPWPPIPYGPPFLSFSGPAESTKKVDCLSCCEGLSTSYFFPRRRPRSRQAKFKMEDFLKHSKVLWCCVLFCFVSIFLNRIHKLCFELFLQVNNYLQVSK